MSLKDNIQSVIEKGYTMKQFEINHFYHVNKGVNPYNIYVISRTAKYIIIRVHGENLKLRIRCGFFGNCEHLIIPTEYKDITLFCTAKNEVA